MNKNFEENIQHEFSTQRNTEQTWEENFIWTFRASTFFFHTLFLRSFSVRQRKSRSKEKSDLVLKGTVMTLEHSGTFLNSLLQSRLDMVRESWTYGTGCRMKGWQMQRVKEDTRPLSTPGRQKVAQEKRVLVGGHDWRTSCIHRVRLL